MAPSTYDILHTIHDWYDGARTGIADFRGVPHYYKCELDYGPSEDYLLSPIDTETFQLALEEKVIWERWRVAFEEGRTPHETHPALPEDQVRHKEIIAFLYPKLVIESTSSLKVKADFLYGENLVKWTVRDK